MSAINVIFPVETISRELDYRLALAIRLAQPKHRIFIGATLHTYRLMERMNAGVFFGKHVFFPWKSPAGPLAYHMAKSRGFSVIHFSEEGAVFMGDDESSRADLDRQFNPSILEPEDYIATWGDWQRDHYRSKAPPCRDNIRTIGHPRFDLYRPEYRELYEDDRQRILERFGKFVLFNTNFGLALHPQGADFVFSRAEHYDPNDDVARERFVAQWSRICQTVPAYVEFIHRLSIRRKDVNFVIRPHPSDDPHLLHAAFRDVSNVHVVREGIVAPWILASRLMVHDGCTTGMEGYLLDKPVVNYRPIPDPETELFFANSFGIPVEGKQDALSLVLDSIDRPDDLRARMFAEPLPDRVHTLLANFRHDSFKLTLQLLDEAEGRAKGTARTPPPHQVYINEARAWAVEQAKATFLRPLSPKRRVSALHAKWRFSGFDRNHIDRRIDILQRVEQKRVKHRVISPNLIEVSA